jgi:hypothetical protein
MAKFNLLIGVVIVVVFAVPVFAQDCYTYLTINSHNQNRETRTFSVPAYLENNCPIGAFQLYITTDQTGIITPIEANTTGSRIAYWEYFNSTRIPDDSSTLAVVAIANMPGGAETSSLDSGNGLLFNIIFEFGCDFDMNIPVNIEIDTLFFSDNTGYVLYDVITSFGNINIGEDMTMRGDADGDSEITALDIICLLDYFRGGYSCPLSFRAGDANGDSLIKNSDISYLARYLYRSGPPPPP